MIIVKVWGGLGNQLFQYATARSLADRLCSQLVIDRTWFDQYIPEATPRTYQLECFNIRAQSPRLIEAAIIKSMRYRVSRFIAESTVVTRCREKDLRFDANILHQTGDIYLDGYWQSYKYFEDNRSALIGDMCIGGEQSVANKNVGDLIDSTNSVAVHVRRGDYVSSQKNISIHAVCDSSYFQRAFDIVCKKVESPHFFIFSDEPEWAEQNVRPQGLVSYISHNNSEQAVQDFWLMKKCKHQIISNSTFSWWAAYLNQYPSKIVVSPTRWYANKIHSIEDIVPNSWIRL